MGIVPRSMSTMKEWRDHPRIEVRGARSGTARCRARLPGAESFTPRDNGCVRRAVLLGKADDDVERSNNTRGCPVTNIGAGRLNKTLRVVVVEERKAGGSVRQA